MPKNCIVILLLLAKMLPAQNYAGKWEGDGFYAPGQSITTVMKKMGGRKKLTLDLTADGSITGTLIVTYDKSKATIVNESADQVFTVAGRLDLNRQLLLLTVTHTKINATNSDAGIPFQKPDSIYYSVELAVRNNKNVMTAGVNKKNTRNASSEWVGSSRGSGMGMNITDDISMHMLPLNLVLENNTYKVPPASETAVKISEEPIVAKSTAKQMPSANPPAVATTTNITNPLDPKIPRKKVIQRTIELDTGLIKLDLYDNGEIDGDIATLLLDGKSIIENQLLSTKAATVSLTLSKQPGEHILELFALNLGSIPPNSALVVLTCNKKRYEIFLSSNGTENGSVKLVLK